MPRVDNTQVELDELLDRLMQYSYDYGSGNIPTSENPPLLIARQAKQAITSLMKELLEEAKPEVYKETWYNKYIITPEQELLESQKRQYNRGIDEYEQNVLKALEEV